MSDPPLTAYVITRSLWTHKAIGEIEESALNGIVVAKDQPELAEAIRAAVQHLIDSGHMERVLAAWGNEAGLIPDRKSVAEGKRGGVGGRRKRREKNGAWEHQTQ